MDEARLSVGASALAAALRWRLQTAIALRACRSELWDLDHINGWQVVEPPRFAEIRSATPAGRAAHWADATALAAHIDQDVANLRRGLNLGYSAPKSVVKRVIAETDALLALSPNRSPFFAAARTAADAGFQSQWRRTVSSALIPAVQRFRAFLQTDYLQRARTTLGVFDLPNGKACYAAHLKAETTLDRPAPAVIEVGLRTVAQSQKELGDLGQGRQGRPDPLFVLNNSDADPSNHFGSPDQLLAFSRRALKRTVAMSAPLFEHLPAQSIVTEPLAPYQTDFGMPSHYEPQSDPSKSAVFRIALSDWAHETIGAAEVTTAHETVPGHHLQVALARQRKTNARYADISFNAAYVEGWANYAERLAEETGIYKTMAAKVFRRAVLGRSLVVDPGIHWLGWSRARARDYMMKAGVSPKGADEMIDRIAVQPAQLTAYETGGLDIYQLREETRRRLGSTFDLKKFHQRVLERGVVTLADLERYVRAWDGR